MSFPTIGAPPLGGALVTLIALLGAATVEAGTPERLLDVPFVSQSENLCGGAAVAMVLRYWGARSVFAEDFAAFLDADGSGIPAGKLVEAARGRGASAVAFRGDEAIVRRQLDSGRPLVVLLEVGRDRYHYVVLVGWSAEVVVLHDPVRGAFRRFAPAEFRERWSGSRQWSLLILPRETREPVEPTGNVTGLPVESAASETSVNTACAGLVAEAVALAGEGALGSAESRLDAALESCPDDPRALGELAGVRLLQSRNDAASDLAERALKRDPTDGHAWRTLATARFLDGDADGALDAWNHLGEPAVDLTSISGAVRTPPGLLVLHHGLEPRSTLRPESLARARRRLSDFPALSFSAVRYRPVPGGFAEIEVDAVERPLFLDGPIDLVSRSLRTLTDRELSLEVSNAARRGERWAASWRFWEQRPRLAVSLDAPRLFRLPGVGRLQAEWDRQSYAIASDAVTRETRRALRLELSDWAASRTRWEIAFGGEAWEERGSFVSIGGALEQRWLKDRLSAQVSATGFLGSGVSFATGTFRAHWRSSARRSATGSPLRLLARARLGTTSNGAPLALWQGAGVGKARPTLLRAHPLLMQGVIAGKVFGRHLLSGGLEVQRFRSRPALIGIGLAVFVDAAKSWETLADDEPTQVDLGAGLRLSFAGHGTFRLDVARGLSDGNLAASLGFELGWPEG